MTVNEYLANANYKLKEDAIDENRSYGNCEVVSYVTDVKVKLPNGNIRTYHSEYPGE